MFFSAEKIFSRRTCLLLTALLFRNAAFTQLIADFSADRSGGCSPLVVSFTNKSTGATPNAVYRWDFGNGNSSSLVNPGAVYTDEKTYSVTLLVQDGAQTSSKTKEITVFKNPAVDFTVSVAKGCLPLTVNFTSQADPGDGTVSGYTWDFGDGSTQQGDDHIQSHIYNTAQTATASLTVTNSYGCHTTLQKPDLITIIPSLKAGFSTDKKVLCQISDPVQFINASSGPGTLSYLWDFGDGNTSTDANPNYAFNKKGIYSVRLTVKSSEGCTADIQQTDYLNAAGYNSDFDGPGSICQGSSANFISKSTPVPDYSIWEVDGVQIYSYSSLSYLFNTPGTHTVKLDNTFGTCKQSVSRDIVVKESPALNAFDANPDSKCGGKVTYQFRDHTPTAVKWEWDFNHRYDPPQIGSDLQAPSYTYDNDGTYPVWLRVTNAVGCSSTVTQNVEVSGPRVSITATGDANLNSCAKPITQTFAANTNEVLVDYKWTFGDGESSTEASPTHTFKDEGRYTVTLNYTTQTGCQGSVTKPNYINIFPRPTYDFSASETDVCGETQIAFTATPNDPNVSLWAWTFGDGSTFTSFSPNAFQTYSHPGIYSIKLFITGIACDTIITKENYITVRDVVAKISGFTNSCDDMRGEVSFTQASTNASDLVWDFGDGSTLHTTADQLTVKHSYNKTGSYPVTLTASNNQCIQTDRTTVYILLKQKPVLSASLTQACLNDPVPIQISGLEGNPEPFPYANPYNVKLEYADGSLFDGSRNDSWGQGGQTYSGTLYNFNRPDETLRAIVISSYFNCTDTSNFIPLKIKDAGATAGFEVVADNLCYQSPVQFKDISKTTNGLAIQSGFWDFGDGQTAGLDPGGTIAHTYRAPGTYYATLHISDASGCSSGTPAYAHAIAVDGPLAAFTLSSGTEVPLNSTIHFYNGTNDYGSPNTVYAWDFGDGSAVSNDFNPVHTYPEAGTYTIRLTATNPRMPCGSTASKTIVVKNFNTAFAFTTSFVSGNCPPVLIRFNSLSTNYSSLAWDFGDGVTAGNLDDPSHVYEKPGKYIVTLYGYAPNGLEEKHIDSVFIQSPEASVTASPLAVCLGSSIVFSAKAGNASAYIWDFGDGNIGSTTGGSASHSYLSSGVYQTALMVQDANGCYGKADPGSPITVRPDPVISFSPENPLICRGSAISIQASGGKEYAWSPAVGLSSDAIADPLVSPRVSSKYTVQVTDDFGCKNSKTLQVEVVQPGSIQAGPDTTVCAGNPVPLKASGEEIYQWIETTDGLSNTQIADPVAYPPATTVYMVTGSDKHHCFTDTASLRIGVLPSPEVNAGQDVEIWAGEATRLNGTGSPDVVQWSWLPEKYLSCPDCPSPVCSPIASTDYILTAKNQDGCISSDTVTVKIDCAASRVAIPNIFTPNGDGHNDVFMIKGISVIRHLVIYGRWGEKVFERSNFIASDRSACWNGTFKGMESPTGTYVYYIEMECPAGGLFTRKGSIVLVR